MEEKKYYNIYSMSDIFSGGNPLQQKKYLGLVCATESEIKEFIGYWNKPRVYYHMYDKLYEHMVIAVPVSITELSKLEPYDPETRDWPDLPYGKDFCMKWDKETNSWKD